MGVGGGFIMVPALIYLLKVPTNVVVGTSLFQIIFVAAYTTIVHRPTNQTVDIVLAFVLMVGGVAGAQYGAKAGQRLRGEQLRALLALLVLAVALRLAFDLFSAAGQPLFADRLEFVTDARAPSPLAALALDRAAAAGAALAQDERRRRPGKHRDRPVDRQRGDHRRLHRRRPHHLRRARQCRPAGRRQGRYDVIVVLEGPARPVVVRRKDRVLGMWINTQSDTFVNVPVSYSVATTRMPQDITDPKSYRQLSLGAATCYLEPRGQGRRTRSRIEEFTDALRDRKLATGLLQRAHRRRPVPVAEPVPGHAGAGAQRAGRHAQGARLPVQERRLHQGDLGAACHREIRLRADDLQLVAQPQLRSTACSPCCWRW